MVYGSDATRAAALRTFSGGQLKTSARRPAAVQHGPAAQRQRRAPRCPTTSSFLAGDVRANENIELTSLQTLFVREHNRLADQIARRQSRR